MLLVGACGVVFIGTLFPLVADILRLGKISVGPPYFNTLFVPLTLVLLLVLGVGPLLRWKHDELGPLLRRLAPLLLISLVAGFGLPLLAAEQFHFLVALALSLAFWVMLTSLYDLADGLRHKADRLVALAALPHGFKGMLLAHLGLAVCVIGVAITSAYSVERDVRLRVGEAVNIGPYEFQLNSLRDKRGPNYIATRARVEVRTQSGDVETVLEPEKRIYTVQRMPMTEVAIQPGLTRDLYLALGEPLADGSWAVRIYYKPLVRWIWLGAVLMALGGLLAIADPRYRLARRQAATVPGGADVAQA